MNLEVPIEIIHGNGCASQAASDWTFARTKTALDPANYDGAAYWFEIVTVNNDSVSHDITLWDATNGAAASTITVVNGTSGITRKRATAAFTPAAGNCTYEILIPQTTADDNVKVYTARIIVIQTNATKTRIQIPLAAGVDVQCSYLDNNANYLDRRNTASYGAGTSNYYRYHLKEAGVYATLGATAWNFEAVLSADAGGTAYAEVQNYTDTTDIAETAVSTTSATATLCASAAFSDGLTGFHDGDVFHARIKTSNASYYAYLHAACLYVTVTNLTKVQIFYRVSRRESVTAGGAAASYAASRVLYTVANYTSPTIYYEMTGYCLDAADAWFLQERNSDSLTSGATDLVAHTWGTATRDRWRSTAVTITNGYKLICRAPQMTAINCIVSGFLVINCETQWAGITIIRDVRA